MKQRIYLAIVVIIGLLATYTLQNVLADDELYKIRDQFSSSATINAQALLRAVRYQVEVLHSLRSFVNVADDIDSAQFHGFVAPTLQRHKTIALLEFVSCTSTASADGEICPIRFSEPENRRNVIGLDAGVDSIRRSAMIRAASEDTPIASGIISLGDRNVCETGWVIVMPLYESQLSSETDSNRHSKLEGYVQGVYVSAEFVKAVLDDYPTEDMRIRLWSSQDTEEKSLFAEYSRFPEFTDEESEFQWRGSFEAAGRTWTIDCLAGPDFAARRKGPMPMIVFAVGVFCTIFFSAYFAKLIDRDRKMREENERYVGELTLRDEKMREELGLAKTIQRAMLPHDLPSIDGLRFGVSFVPSGDVGGDYFDFMEREGGKGIGIVFADISGHGVPAALLFAIFRTLARQALREKNNVPEKFRKLNRELARVFPRGRFASTFHAEIDTEAGTLTYVKASQEPALLFRRSEPVRQLDDGDVLLGAFNPEIFGDPEYREVVVRLREGDLIFLYTDGIVEVEEPGGKSLGTEELAKWIEEEIRLATNGVNPQELVDRIVERVYSFAGDPHDVAPQSGGRSVAPLYGAPESGAGARDTLAWNGAGATTRELRDDITAMAILVTGRGGMKSEIEEEVK